MEDRHVDGSSFVGAGACGGGSRGGEEAGGEDEPGADERGTDANGAFLSERRQLITGSPTRSMQPILCNSGSRRVG
jgi:hypothetical protein